MKVHLFTLLPLALAATPTKIGMLLFPGFQALDVFGPLDIFNIFAFSTHFELALIGPTLAPVTTRGQMPNAHNSTFYQDIVPTHTLATAPGVQVLFVPGGIGTRASDDVLRPYIEYIAAAYPKLEYLVSICTGAGLVARAGVLDGRNATTNKKAWNSTVVHGPETNWIGNARWVVDGNVYTSSGVSAGIDATFQFVEDVWGKKKADELAVGIEHRRVLDWRDDPFADYWGVPDVPPLRNVTVSGRRM